MTMNSTTRELSSKNDLRPHLFVALMLACAGAVCLAAGIVDRAIVRAQEQGLTLSSTDSAEALDTAESYLRYARWIPAVRRRLDDVQVRRASLHYWRQEYDRIVPPNADPLAGIPEDNVELQFIAANAAYRRSQATARDRTNTLSALDAAINAYVAVLRNGGHEAAAYNYEYLARLRDDIDKGRRPADLTDKAADGPAGEQGGPPPEGSDNRDLKILIPLDPAELDKATDPGKGAPIDRKG